jgi:hypothetical protein
MTTADIKQERLDRGIGQHLWQTVAQNDFRNLHILAQITQFNDFRKTQQAAR